MLHCLNLPASILIQKWEKLLFFQVAVLLVLKTCHSSLSWQTIRLVMVKVLISSLIKQIY